jgi:HEAT repeat protein
VKPLLHLLLLVCGCPSPQEPAPSTLPRSALHDPGQYAAKAAPSQVLPWEGAWTVSVVSRSAKPGPTALATGLGVPLQSWDGSVPQPRQGELAVLWLEPGEAPQGGATHEPRPPGGAAVAVLGPGDDRWATRQAQALPWLGLEVLDAQASLALWANPTLANDQPELAGLVMARELASKLELDYRPPVRSPIDVPGLAQWLWPGSDHDPAEPRARATAAATNPAPSLADDPEPAVRLAVARASRDQAVLSDLATDPEPLVRARAADAISDPSRLARLAQDPSSVVRVVATHRLASRAQQGDHSPEVQRALLDIAASSPDAYQRWKAAYGLGWIPGQAPALLALLEDPDVDVRRQAVTSLGRQGDPQALEPLLATLGDPNSFLRTTTAQALGALRDARAIPALREALQDPTALVAAAAADSLRRLGEAAEAPRYHPPRPADSAAQLAAMLASDDATLRKDACKYTAGRTDALDLLAQATRDPDPEVRKSAAHALGWANDSAPVLLPLLRDSDPDVLVATMESLRQVGGFEPLDLAPLLAHPDAELRLRAAEAVASMGPSSLLAPLAADPDERVRAAFARAQPELITAEEPSLLVRRAAAAGMPDRWREDPSALVRFAATGPPDLNGAWWALGVLAHEDELVHLRFSFNDEARIPRSHQSLRPPVVREYGHPDRG